MNRERDFESHWNESKLINYRIFEIERERERESLI